MLMRYDGEKPKVHAGGYSFKRGVTVDVGGKCTAEAIAQMRAAGVVEVGSAPVSVTAPAAVEEADSTGTADAADVAEFTEDTAPMFRRGRGRPRKEF